MGWQEVPISGSSSTSPTGTPGAAVTPPAPVSTSNIPEDKFPGALNTGWTDYYQWASKDYSAWSSAFDEAESARIEESRRWLEYYNTVYSEDMSWWKKLTMFALNGVQLWALWKQFQQQRDLADKTHDIAERVQKIAEELFSFYKETYYPHEIALSKQINGYFENPYCANYSGTGDKFDNNMKLAFRAARESVTRCTSSICAPFTDSDNLSWEIEQMQAIGNARNGAYRYEELRKDTKDNKWLELRMKFIQIGRNVSQDGQNGIMKAFNTFSSFGADPGAALSQMLGVLSNTVGQMISSPTAPKSDLSQLKSSNLLYQPFFGNVMQSGDVQPAKTQKITYTG